VTTRDGKPYFKVGFRDAGREVSFPSGTTRRWPRLSREVEAREFYKVRAMYRETPYARS